MPDYFPAVNNGPAASLAEETARLIQQRGAAWGDMYKGIGQNIGQGLQGAGQAVAAKREKQQQNLSADQLSALQSQDQEQIAKAFPKGLTPQAQTMAGVYAKNKMMMSRGFVPNTDTMKQAAASVGYDIGNEEFISNREADMISKLAQQKAKPVKADPKKDDEANRKLVTDYAASHGVSLDALRPGGMGGWNSANLAMAAKMVKDHPEYDPQKMKLDFAAQQKSATTAAGKSADIITNLNSAHGGFKASMDAAMPLAGKYSLGYINEILNSGGRNLNNQDEIELYGHLHLAALNSAKIAKGGNASLSEAEEANADKMFSTKLNKNGLKGMYKVVETEYKGRVEGAKKGVSSDDKDGEKVKTTDLKKDIFGD